MIELKPWTTYDACAAVEGFDEFEHTDGDIIAAWQHLIDSGACWSLQSWYVRRAHRMIASGKCHLPRPRD
jgi:hypothetical protein